MERVYVSKFVSVQIGSTRMPIEGTHGLKGYQDCKTVTVSKVVYQVEYVGGVYYGTDLATLEVVVLDME